MAFPFNSLQGMEGFRAFSAHLRSLMDFLFEVPGSLGHVSGSSFLWAARLVLRVKACCSIILAIQNWRFLSEFRDSCNQQDFILLFRRLLDCHCLKAMLSLLIDSSTVIVFTVHFAWMLVTLIFPQCLWHNSALMYVFIVLLNGKSHCSYDFCHLYES